MDLETLFAAPGVDASDEVALAWVEVTSRDFMQLSGKKPYGDVKYADPKNGKYPINNHDRADAAWKYINKAANAAKYPLNGVSLASVKAAIKAACRRFGIKISEDSKDDD